MRIQHNIMALNANRNLTGNNNAVGKSLEKLSSGYRINRAGDDAAGLAISEKMRAQISCLTQAETNCNDGISLIQTAEGALTEVHDMLNRMVELAEQSANGTYTDETDRENLESELTQLKSEVDRISQATNFNGIKLLDGSLGGYKVSGVTGTGNAVSISGGELAEDDGFNITIAATTGKASLDLTKTVKEGAAAATVTGLSIANETWDAENKVTRFELKVDSTGSQADYEKFNGVVITVNSAGTAMAAGTVSIGADANGKVSSGLTLQIGDTAETFNKLTVAVDNMDCATLGVKDISIATQKGASDSIETIKAAINKVSSTRGDLGAMQNRLEHTVNNLSVTNENITNAESRIRDTDMAKEMMAYTSKNILTQAAQSMLAQANQQPQQVLSLLQ